jgi:hypothetical protein
MSDAGESDRCVMTHSDSALMQSIQHRYKAILLDERQYVFMIKSSRATSRVSCGQKPNVSETISASIIRGMMMTDTACCLRRFYRVQLPRKRQVLYVSIHTQWEL